MWFPFVKLQSVQRSAFSVQLSSIQFLIRSSAGSGTAGETLERFRQKGWKKIR